MGSLANRDMHGIAHGYGRKLRKIKALFTLDAGNAPVIRSHSSLAAAGISAVAMQATGVVRLTLVDSGSRIVDCQATYLAVANNTDLYAQPVVPSSDTATTIDVQLKTGANNTNPPASPNGGVLSVSIEYECSVQVS